MKEENAIEWVAEVVVYYYTGANTYDAVPLDS